MSLFPAVLDLSSLNGSNGFKISGVAAVDFSGWSVASARDVNGDGFADLIIGAYAADPNGGASGASYVVFGKASGFAANLDLSTLTGANGFKISGEATGDKSGKSVSSARDVNGDGFADLIIGALFASPNGSHFSGASYVVFGKASGFAANLDLSTLTGANGFKISGEAADDRSGKSVSSAGDINGDGFADIIIGAPGADPNGSYSGASYVVFGKASGFAANLNLSTLNGTNGFKISGAAANDWSGISVSSAGDINGDGFADLIIGAYRAVPNGIYAGASYVVFGKASGFGANLDLSTLTGANGFKISGEAATGQSGYSVSSAGDINGDGFADLIIGARFAGPNGFESGASYVVFGKAAGFGANLDLSSLNGTNGFKISGVAAGDSSGWSVASAGDVNGDGFADLIIGARFASPNGLLSGASYVVFGKDSGFAANLDLSTLTGINGFKIDGGAAGDFSGGSVSAAGDVNGDGFADLIIGAPGADPNGSYSGASYVLFGHANSPHGDFDRDGNSDILWQNTNGSAGAWLMNGLSQIAGSNVGSNPGTAWHIKGDDDFNGDGRADILWQNNDGSAGLWLMNGFSQLAGSVVGGNPGPTWHIKGADDFNGDHKADILWQNDNGQAGIWLMNGASVLSATAIGSNPGPTWHIKGAGDFDGDGKPDILWQNDNGQAGIWLMSGTSVAAATPVGGNAGPAWHIKGTGDFNGDGKADILWQNDDGTPGLWLMNSTNVVSAAPLGNPGTAWHVERAEDFNGDGKSDILWQNDSGQAGVWLMDGLTQLSAGTVGANPGPAWHLDWT